jgi:hypothetical protein
VPDFNPAIHSLKDHLIEELRTQLSAARTKTKELQLDISEMRTALNEAETKLLKMTDKLEAERKARVEWEAEKESVYLNWTEAIKERDIERKARAEAERERDGLRCCGNCMYYSHAYGCHGRIKNGELRWHMCDGYSLWEPQKKDKTSRCVASFEIKQKPRGQDEN